MSKKLLGIAVAVLLLAGASVKAQQSATIDPERLAAARSLFQAMSSEQQFEVAIKTMTEGMAGIAKQSNPSHAKEIDEVFGKIREKFLARTAEVTDLIAPLWAEKFTIQEMSEISRFMQSDIGRKMIKAQPEIMQKAMQIGMAWGRRIGQEVEDEARRELKARGVDL